MEDVENNPTWYDGKQVTLVGEVDDVYSKRSFQLEGNEALFDSEILVVTKSDVMLGGQGLEDDDDVLVSGKVKKFMIAELERDIGWDLPMEVETEWKGKAVLVADSVSRMDEYSRWSETGDQLVSITAVYYYPDRTKLEGSSVELESVPIREVSNNGIWIGENEDSQLYVALPQQQLKGLTKDDRVDVQGTVRKVPERDQMKTGWQMSDEQADAAMADAVYIEAKKVEKAKLGQQARAK